MAIELAYIVWLKLDLREKTPIRVSVRMRTERREIYIRQIKGRQVSKSLVCILLLERNGNMQTCNKFVKEVLLTTKT